MNSVVSAKREEEKLLISYTTPELLWFKLNLITGKLKRAMSIEYKYKRFREDTEKMIKFRLISHNVGEFLPSLKDYLEKEEDICLTHPIGSFASGNVGAMSDVDITVLLNEKLEVQRWW